MDEPARLLADSARQSPTWQPNRVRVFRPRAIHPNHMGTGTLEGHVDEVLQADFRRGEKSHLRVLLRRNRVCGFTLVELMIVIAIIGVLVALLLPAVQAARESARRTHCLNNERQLGLALLKYEQANTKFPAGNEIQGQSAWWSWIVRILPNIEEAPLYNRNDLKTNAFSSINMATNHAVYSQVVNLLGCPDDPLAHRVGNPECGGQMWCDFAYTNYLGVTGTQGGQQAADDGYKGDGMFPDTNICVELRSVTDGTSHTVFIGERPVVDFFVPQPGPTGWGDYGWWAAGAGNDWPPRGRGDNILDSSEGLFAGDPESRTDIFHWWSYHVQGAHFVFVDGSARYLSYDTDHNVVIAISSRNGAETLDMP
jgi:prepilin-type N-terminal cleavage/methylation domain-containing protein